MISKDALAPYEGREQAYVKHELLKAYLERFMMILGQHCPRVLYVDCFAGPWESSAEDFSDTSFGRAIQIIRGCQSALKEKFGKEREFRALFLEKDPEAFAKLDAFSNQFNCSSLKIEAWNCQFQNKVKEVASWVGSDFAFVLIDPKGYKGLIEPKLLAPLLCKRNVEALINYMWQFLSMAVGHLENAAHRENLVALYGAEVVNASITQQVDRESWLLSLYRQYLVKASSTVGSYRTRTVSFPVEYPGRTSTKYFLIHTTHNDLGVIKFAEASQEAAATQHSVRFMIQQQKKELRTGTEDLFANSPVELAAGDREMTQPWLKLIPVAGDEIVVNEAIMAKMIEENDCFLSELQRGAARLIELGQIQNLDMKRRRPTNVVHFKGNGERLRRLK